MPQDTIAQSYGARPKIFYGYIIILLSFFVLAINAGSRTTFGVFLKPILADFESTRGLLSGVFSLSLLVNGCLSIPVGRLVDKIGPRLIITFCGISMGVGYLLMSQATAIWQMYLIYGILIGAGNALHVPIMSTVVRWFHTKRNIMLGIVGIGGSMGTMILPPCASLIVSAYDWRVSFAVLGSFIMIVLIVSAQFLKNNPTAPDYQAHDLENINGSSPPSDNSGFTLKEALMTRPLWLFVLLYFVFGASCFTFMVHIVAYATDRGISATNAAAIVSVVGAMGIVSRLILGRIGDRFGVSLSLPMGLFFRLVALICALFAEELWAFYGVAILFGLSWGANVQGTSWMAQTFGTRSVGAITGTCNIGFTVGVAAGPLLAGYIYDSTHSYMLAFLMTTMIVFFGLVITKLLPTTAIERKPV